MALTEQKLQRPLSFEVPYLHGNWLGDSELIPSLPLPGNGYGKFVFAGIVDELFSKSSKK